MKEKTGEDKKRRVTDLQRSEGRNREEGTWRD